MTIESPSKWHYSSDLLVFFLSRVIFFYSFFFGCCCWGNIFYLLSERWSDNQTATWQIWLKRCYFSFKKYYIFARIGNSSTKQSQKTIAKEKYKFVCIFFFRYFVCRIQCSLENISFLVIFLVHQTTTTTSAPMNEKKKLYKFLSQ